ncbi:MAG: RNA methyltransferase [Bacteroidota bacterium]|nr:RNA methyltransferase [Bacteroidota bacterium]
MEEKQPAKKGRSLETISVRRRAKLEAVLRKRQPDLTIVIENIWDPHNVAAILRTADAVGIARIHLVYTIEDPPDLRRKGKQSSASANKWVDIVRHRTMRECIDVLHGEGFRVYASRLGTSSLSLFDIDATHPSAFVFGNEHRGVSDECLALADTAYMIPMAGMIQSLNVSVAAAVTVYEAFRQRTRAGFYDAPRLDEATIRERLEVWARR